MSVTKSEYFSKKIYLLILRSSINRINSCLNIKDQIFSIQEQFSFNPHQKYLWLQAKLVKDASYNSFYSSLFPSLSLSLSIYLSLSLYLSLFLSPSLSLSLSLSISLSLSLYLSHVFMLMQYLGYFAVNFQINLVYNFFPRIQVFWLVEREQKIKGWFMLMFMALSISKDQVQDAYNFS